MFRLQRMDEEYEERTKQEEWQQRREERIAEAEKQQQKKSAKRKAKVSFIAHAWPRCRSSGSEHYPVYGMRSRPIDGYGFISQ